MKVTINGVQQEVPVARTLSDLLRALDVHVELGGIAVAQNDKVVPRARWGDTPVAEDDRFEIITAVQGG